MKRAFITLFSLLLYSVLVAQIQYKFRHFTTDDGLPTNSIYAITEDKNGNIILGTDNGLTFFDGNDFKTLNVKDGLINPYIVAVTKDENGVVWFINYGGKLQKFENNAVVTTSIFTSQANDFLSTKNNLYLFNSQNRYSNNSYFFIQINKKNWKIDTFKNNTNAATKQAPPILVQNNEQIIFEANFLSYKNIKVAVPKQVSLIHKVIFRKNDVVILDENDLFFIDFAGRIKAQVKLPSSISEKVIYKHDFVVDRQNNCWLNIQNKGLFILKNNKWVSINESLGLNATDNVNYLFCDSNGKMWIATNEKGLFCIPNTLISYYKFVNQNNYFNGFATSTDAKSLFISSKFCLYLFKNGELNCLKKSSCEVKIDNFNALPVFFIPTKQLTKWDSNLKMLVVSGKQLLKYNSEESISLNGVNGINSNQSQIVSNIKEKIKNSVLYKNEYYFNNSTKITIRTFSNNQFKIKRELKLNNKGYIQDFAFINDTMWLATEGKVYKAVNEKIVDSISTINNTKVENVFKIKVSKTIVFLCSSSGLYIIKKNQNRSLNKYNYLPNNEVYNAILFENDLWVATKDGLAKIKTNLIFSASQKPKLQLYYDNKITTKINLPNNQEVLKIELKIQNFSAVKNQIIQYKIDNLNWINTENKTLIFQSLYYGRHEVTVRVKDVNSAWDIKKIVINKSFPFYLKWWFIVLVNILLIAVVYEIYKNQITKINAKKQLEIYTNTRVAELRQSALSAMMNPHFIFNSLNAIQYFINSNQNEKSSEHLAKLSRLVRLFLSQSAEPFITLIDEINRLKLYIELEQIRFENFVFNLNIDQNIDPTSIKIPNMIVQPFIENAILHGVSHLTEKDGKIDLKFSLINDILTIEVIDNGFGIDTNKVKNDTHLSKGISIIKERIEILQQVSPEKVFLITEEHAFSDAIRKGYKVTLVITI